MQSHEEKSKVTSISLESVVFSFILIFYLRQFSFVEIFQNVLHYTVTGGEFFSKGGRILCIPGFTLVMSYSVT